MTKKHAGFSLIELMITIAIFSILAAIATPNAISWLRNSQFNSAVREMKTSMEGMRMYAVKNNSQAVIRFNGGNTFETEKRNRGTADPADTTMHRLPPGITVTSLTFPGNELTYSSRGMASEGTIGIEGNNGLCQRIVVSSVGSSRIVACP